MAPTIQAQHVVAVTIPTIAVLFFTYLWYKKRSNSISRSRNDPGGGGGTSRKRTRHRNNATGTTATATATAALPSSAAPSVNISSNLSLSTLVESRETFPEAMKNAMQKAIRDLETASPIQEICSDAEEGQSRESESSQTAVTSEMREEVDAAGSTDDRVSDCSSAANVGHAGAPAEDADQGGEVMVGCVDEEPTQAASPCHDAISVEDDGKDSESKCASGSDDAGVACCNASRPNDVGENLDAAMLKLESMRMSDNKAKRKPTTVSAKRQNLNSMSPTSPNNDRSKSPSTSALSQLASPPPSKARKRRSKRRLRAGQNSGNGDNAGDAGVGSGSSGETAVKSAAAAAAAANTTTSSSKVACDSDQSVGACASRTDKRWASDSEKVCCTSRENDRLSSSIKESRNCDLKVIENHQKDCDNERDSANHSPVDTMLDCPSARFSDAHSEGSSDSGKGCSEGAISPPPQTAASSIAGDQNTLTWYQFIIPQEHVGKLIGKNGQFINTIKASSNTRIFIKKHPTSFKKKICALEGTQEEIKKALELIRIRFPEETYPDLTLDEFPLAPQQQQLCPLRSDLLQLNLVEGVNNDVVISSIVTAGHLFLQQPMHPSYQSLLGLNMSMNHVYASPEAPLVSKPAKDVIVAAPAMGGWYRAQVTAVDDDSQTCEVRFVDYGGYLSLSTSCLRAIRSDFMTLPFQAVECLLANIAPINDSWSEEAKLVVQGLTYGQILQAQVCDFVQDVPLILLYVVIGSQVILINDELIARGFAYSTITNEGVQAEDYYAYS